MEFENWDLDLLDMADQVEDIKAKTDIVSVISERVDLKKAGRNYKAPCPFHSEKVPSFVVSPELQIFKCFGCFPADELVKTPFGFHKIQNVVDGEYVVSGKGNFKKVITTHKRNYEGDLVTVKLSMLTEKVSLTGDHLVYIIGGSRLYKSRYKYLSRRFRVYQRRGYSKKEILQRLWKYSPVEKVEARRLKKGMTLLYPIDTVIRDVKSIDLSSYISKKWPSHGTKPLIPPLEVCVDDNLLKLIGYYVAEGSNHRAYIRFSLGGHEQSFAEEIRRLIRKVFCLEASIHQRTKTGKSGIEVTVCNSVLANVFENLCGKGTDNKRLPFIFQQMPLKKQKILLNAVWRGDGYSIKPNGKIKTPACAITTTSKILEEQIRDLLLRLGYFPSLCVQSEKKDKFGVNHKKSYVLRWLINPKHSKFKCTYVDQGGNKFWLLPVLGTKRQRFAGKVYNLTVEDDHSYVANTFAVANCGESGDVISFLQKYEAMDFYEALKLLAERAGIELKAFSGGKRSIKEKLFQINSLTARFYAYILLRHPIGKSALTYLTSDRKLKLATIRKFGLGYSPDRPLALKSFLVEKNKIQLADLEKAGIVYFRGARAVDRFRGRIIFPLYDHRGNVTGFAGRTLPGKDSKSLAKYINSPETEIYHKSAMLYGLNLTKKAIKQKKQTVVVEGELDMISSWQAGIGNVVAIKGSALTQEQLQLLSRYTQKIVIAMDADAAGDNAAKRGIEMAERQGFDVSVATLSGYKDPDEMAKKDPSGLKRTIKNSKDVWEFLIDLTFSRHKGKGGQVKAKISREVVPILASISDKIVQAHYIDQVAKRLRVPVDAVLQQVVKKGTQTGVSEVGVQLVTRNKERKRREILEERLLTVAFTQDPSILKKRKIFSLFTTPLAKQIAMLLKKYILKRSKFSFSKFASTLPEELKPAFSDIVLKGTEGLEQDDKNIYPKELDMLIHELLEIDIKEKLEKTAKDICKLELKKQTKKLQKAKEQFRKLSKKLAELEVG